MGSAASIRVWPLGTWSPDLAASQKDIALCSAKQLLELGIRDPVVPSVKGEPPPLRKIYQTEKDEHGVIRFVLDEKGDKIRLKHPRWRTIYAQSMVDELVSRMVEKVHNTRQVALYQLGASVAKGIGCGSSDEKIQMTKAQVFAAAQAAPALSS